MNKISNETLLRFINETDMPAWATKATVHDGVVYATNTTTAIVMPIDKFDAGTASVNIFHDEHRILSETLQDKLKGMFITVSETINSDNRLDTSKLPELLEGLDKETQYETTKCAACEGKGVQTCKCETCDNEHRIDCPECSGEGEIADITNITGYSYADHHRVRLKGVVFQPQYLDDLYEVFQGETVFWKAAHAMKANWFTLDKINVIIMPMNVTREESDEFKFADFDSAAE